METEGNVLDKPAYAWYCSVCSKANVVDEKGIEIDLPPSKEDLEGLEKVRSKIEKYFKDKGWGEEE